jgi:hypothetical protein
LIVGTQVDMREDTSIKNEDEEEQDPNIPQKLHALKVFVTEHSEWIGKAVLVQVAFPSRQDVEESQNLRAQDGDPERCASSCTGPI